MAPKYMVLETDGFGNWESIGSSENLSVARSAYNKRRVKASMPVALVKVLETNTNTDRLFGDDISEMRDLEYDV